MAMCINQADAVAEEVKVDHAAPKTAKTMTAKATVVVVPAAAAADLAPTSPVQNHRHLSMPGTSP